MMGGYCPIPPVQASAPEIFPCRIHRPGLDTRTTAATFPAQIVPLITNVQPPDEATWPLIVADRKNHIQYQTRVQPVFHHSVHFGYHVDDLINGPDDVKRDMENDTAARPVARSR